MKLTTDLEGNIDIDRKGCISYYTRIKSIFNSNITNQNEEKIKMNSRICVKRIYEMYEKLTCKVLTKKTNNVNRTIIVKQKYCIDLRTI